MSDIHIKGPWYVRYCDDESHMCMTAIWSSPVPEVNCDQYEDRDYADAVAIVYHQCYPFVNPDGVEAAEARANLISAAPDLLQALARMELAFRAVLRGKPVRDADEVIAEATSAIAKAQGHDHE
ncbi:hypothetical protein ISN75_06645 [Dyella marensis]|uniref:hypothetical protein n=1 Tax=Dyella marensis TaxID=500610 RepID=UPI0031D1B6BC